MADAFWDILKAAASTNGAVSMEYELNEAGELRFNYNAYLNKPFYDGPEHLGALTLTSTPEELYTVFEGVKKAVAAYQAEQQAQREEQAVIHTALCKLTPKEIEALGFSMDYFKRITPVTPTAE